MFINSAEIQPLFIINAGAGLKTCSCGQNLTDSSIESLRRFRQNDSFGKCHTGQSEAAIRYLQNKRIYRMPDQVRHDKCLY
jgi:hypothetical protein